MTSLGQGFPGIRPKDPPVLKIVRRVKFQRVPQKGPAERGHVKNRRKVSKNICDTFRHDFSRRAKKTSEIVEKCQKHFRHFSTLLFARHQFPASEYSLLREKSLRRQQNARVLGNAKTCQESQIDPRPRYF